MSRPYFDVAIPSPRLVERLAACFRAVPALGVLSPLVSDNGPSRSARPRRPSRGLYLGVIRRLIAPGARERRVTLDGAVLEERPYAAGCAMMISRGCLERTGFLSEEFFMYMVEPEYCFRARREGFLTMALLDERARVVHHAGGATRPWKTYFYARNQFLFLRLFPRWTQAAVALVFCGSLVERVVRLGGRRGPYPALCYAAGFLAGLRIWFRDLLGAAAPGACAREERERFMKFAGGDRSSGTRRRRDPRPPAVASTEGDAVEYPGDGTRERPVKRRR